MAAALAADTKSTPAPISQRSNAATGPVLVILQAEAFLEMVVAVAVYRHLGGTWLMFALLFAVPDVSMVGYFINPRIGASLYNLGHTYIIPAVLGLAGFLMANPLMYLLALIWLAHISFDRAIGAGLKYPVAFGMTHLRWKAPRSGTEFARQ